MKKYECHLVSNDCYKKATQMTPVGIVVHSTGAANKTVRRYVQPVKGQKDYTGLLKILGKNSYNNHWNKSGVEKCVHAFLGEIADGSVAVVETLPHTVASWGCGSGKKGSYNRNPTGHIQFEMCEGTAKDKAYALELYDVAVQYCAYLCKLWELDPYRDIVSHNEAHGMGFASNHGDPENYWKQFGLTMDCFRADVDAILNPKIIFQAWTGRVVNVKSKLNIRDQASTKGVVIGSIAYGCKVKILAEEGNWGKVQHNGVTGWVHLGYIKKV